MKTGGVFVPGICVSVEKKEVFQRGNWKASEVSREMSTSETGPYKYHPKRFVLYALAGVELLLNVCKCMCRCHSGE